MKQQTLRGWTKGPGVWAKSLGGGELAFELYQDGPARWILRSVYGTTWILEVSGYSRATLKANRILKAWLRKLEDSV